MKNCLDRNACFEFFQQIISRGEKFFVPTVIYFSFNDSIRFKISFIE